MKYANANNCLVWRNGDLRVTKINSKTFQPQSSHENFWTLGYQPKHLCSSNDGKYLIGLSESSKNSVLTVSCKDEQNGEFFMRKIEISSKEKWVGMDVSTSDIGLVVCDLRDTKFARGDNSNPDVYPKTLSFSLYDFKSASL